MQGLEGLSRRGQLPGAGAGGLGARAGGGEGESQAGARLVLWGRFAWGQVLPQQVGGGVEEPSPEKRGAGCSPLPLSGGAVLA